MQIYVVDALFCLILLEAFIHILLTIIPNDNVKLVGGYKNFVTVNGSPCFVLGKF